MEREIEVRYNVELLYKLQVPADKTLAEAVNEFINPIYNGGKAEGETVPKSAMLRFLHDENGNAVFT